MANHSRAREDQRNDIIKVVTMMSLMTVTTMYANRLGTPERQIGAFLKGMSDVMEGFLPGDGDAVRRVRGHLSEALGEIARDAGESVPHLLTL